MPQYKQNVVIRQHCHLKINAYLLLSKFMERIQAKNYHSLNAVEKYVLQEEFCKSSMMKQPETSLMAL